MIIERSASFFLSRSSPFLQTLPSCSRFFCKPTSLSSKRRVRVSSTTSGRGEEMDHQFQLSPSSVLKLQKGDITVWSVDGSTDAILAQLQGLQSMNLIPFNHNEVNAANERMLEGGGVAGAIHRAAGPELLKACRVVPEVQPRVRCPTGEARITPGFRLPVSRVIHTVGPIYDVHPQPQVLLENAYRNSLRLAKENSIQYIAFPAISCGIYGYPYDEASRIAISTIKEFSNEFKEENFECTPWLHKLLKCKTEKVHFVLFLDDIYQTWLKTARQLL